MACGGMVGIGGMVVGVVGVVGMVVGLVGVFRGGRGWWTKDVGETGEGSGDQGEDRENDGGDEDGGKDENRDRDDDCEDEGKDSNLSDPRRLPLDGGVVRTEFRMVFNVGFPDHGIAFYRLAALWGGSRFIF